MSNKLVLGIICGAAIAASGFAIAASQLSFVRSFSGPYDATSIHKLYDSTEGVVCYVYAPNSVSFNKNYNSKTRQMETAYGNNTIGSISCVKK